MDEKIARNVQTYISGLEELGFNFEEISREEITNAPAGLNISSGTAYYGALANHCVTTLWFANQILTTVQKAFGDVVSPASLKKVIFLQQISKAKMMIPNDNQWEIEKRGMAFKFASQPGVLQAGERSILIATNSGIKFTPEEFEAMQILDKDGDELKKLRFAMSPLTMIVEQANTLAYALEKSKVNQ